MGHFQIVHSHQGAQWWIICHNFQPFITIKGVFSVSFHFISDFEYAQMNIIFFSAFDLDFLQKIYSGNELRNFANKIFTNYRSRRTWVNCALQAANLSKPQKKKEERKNAQATAHVKQNAADSHESKWPMDFMLTASRSLCNSKVA